jgi:hypothetical protein
MVFSVICGCGFSEYSAKEDAKKESIVKAIIESKSTVNNVKSIDALSIVLAVSGKFTKDYKWQCDKNVNDGSYDVWLSFVANDNPVKIHWVVDKDNNLFPANDLAQKITVKQKLNIT